MLCTVEGCGRDADYKAACLCQKHYFRVRRTGGTQLKPRTRVQRFVGLGGYVFVYAKGHPLAGDEGTYVREHRRVVYDDLGPGPMNCELCDKVVTWETVHIDHKNDDRQDNRRENLRPTCSVCNTQRGRAPEHTYAGRYSVTFEGVTLTPTEWARDPRVKVSSSAIRLRLRAGATAEEALFAPKATHKS